MEINSELILGEGEWGLGIGRGGEGSYAENEVVIEGEKYSAVRCTDLLSVNSSFLHRVN